MAEACLSRSCRILLAFCLTYTAQVMVSSIFGSFLGGLFKLEYRVPKPSIDILTAYFLPCRSASLDICASSSHTLYCGKPGPAGLCRLARLSWFSRTWGAWETLNMVRRHGPTLPRPSLRIIRRRSNFGQNRHAKKNAAQESGVSSGSCKNWGGGLCETRTRDQRIKSPLLYRLS